MAATAAKKTAAPKKAAPTPPEPVELNFTFDKQTTGTYVWAEDEDEDGTVIVGKLYTKKPYYEGYVPGENDTLTLTVQVNQAEV